MLRVVATFVAVWLAVGTLGVLFQLLIVPIPNSVVSLVGFGIAVLAALLVYRRRRDSVQA